MASESERRLILEMIESGRITAEDGLRLLQALPAEPEAELLDDERQSLALDAADAEPPGTPIVEETPSPVELSAAPGGAYQEEPPPPVSAPAQTPDFDRWRRWWMLPLWVGVGITVLGAWLMFAAQQSSGFGFWFLCAWIPFALGLLLIVVAWGSRTARWLHLRVQQQEGEWPRNIAISFPLPLRFTGWFVRSFRGRIPGLEEASIDELLNAVEHSTSPDTPLYVEVEDGERGERVQIYIG